MNTIENAKNELKTKELTFVAMGVNSTWEEADYHTGLLLNKLREDKNSLSGTVAAAHRIGRADALLLCYGGIRELFAEIISYFLPQKLCGPAALRSLMKSWWMSSCPTAHRKLLPWNRNVWTSAPHSRPMNSSINCCQEKRLPGRSVPARRRKLLKRKASVNNFFEIDCNKKEQQYHLAYFHQFVRCRCSFLYLFYFFGHFLFNRIYFQFFCSAFICLASAAYPSALSRISAFSASVTGRIAFAGLPSTSMPSGITVPPVTSAPAPMRQSFPITASLRMMAPMPTRE